MEKKPQRTQGHPDFQKKAQAPGKVAPDRRPTDPENKSGHPQFAPPADTGEDSDQDTKKGAKDKDNKK